MNGILRFAFLLIATIFFSFLFSEKIYATNLLEFEVQNLEFLTPLQAGSNVVISYDVNNLSDDDWIIPNEEEGNLFEYIWIDAYSDEVAKTSDKILFNTELKSKTTEKTIHLIETPNYYGEFTLLLRVYNFDLLISEIIELKSDIFIVQKINTSQVDSTNKAILSAPCQLVHDASVVNQNKKHWEFESFHTTSIDLFANSGRGYIDKDGYLSCIGENAYAPVSGLVVAQKVLQPITTCQGIQQEKIVNGTHYYDHYLYIIGENGITPFLVHINVDDRSTIPNGSNVSTGEFVGRINDAGCAFGKHIHFTVAKNGRNLTYDQWDLTNYNPNSIELNTPSNNSKLSALENIQFSWSPFKGANQYWIILNGQNQNPIYVNGATSISISPQDQRLKNGVNTWQVLTNKLSESGEKIQSKEFSFNLGVAETSLKSPVGGSVFIPKTKEESIKFQFQTHAQHFYEFKVVADGETIYYEDRFPVTDSLASSGTRFITLPKSWFSGYSKVSWQVRPRAAVGGELIHGAWKSASFNLTYPQAAPTPVQKSNGAMPVFRFYNSAVNSHIYTMSTYERDVILDGSPANNWYYEGIGFYAYPLQNGRCESGQRTIYRFRSMDTGRYLYSIYANEVSKNSWYHEGAHYCGLASAQSGAIPAYRLYSATQNRHFLTLSVQEKNSLLQNGWYLDGLLFYAEGAIDTENANSVTVYRFYNNQMKTDRLVADQARADQLASSGSKGWEYKGISFVTSKFSGTCTSGQPIYEYYHKSSQTFHYAIDKSIENQNAWNARWDYLGAVFCAEPGYKNGLMPVYESKYMVSAATPQYQTAYLTNRSETANLADPWTLTAIPFYVNIYDQSYQEIQTQDLHVEYRMNFDKMVGGSANTHIVTITNTGNEKHNDVAITLSRSGILSFQSASSGMVCSNKDASYIECSVGALEAFETKAFNIATAIGNANVDRNIEVQVRSEVSESINANNSASKKLEVRSLQPVTRYYNPSAGSHIWSIYSSERNSLDRSRSWHKEGTAFRAYQLTSGGSCPAGTHPTYRLRNASKPFYLYTINKGYYNALSSGSGWYGEGVGFCTPPSNKSGARPIYRLYNARNGNHLFTASANERNVLMRAGWYYEGVHFYAH